MKRGMGTLFSWVALAGMLVLITGAGFAQEAVGGPTEIEALREQWIDRYNAGDIAAVNDLYADDAALYDASGVVLEGREAIRAGMQTDYDAGAVDVELQALDTQVDGDMAFDLGRYAFRSPDGQVAAEGHYLVVMRRVDGEWRIYRQMANYLPPAEVASEPGASLMLSFVKEDPDGDATWDGSVGGDAEGSVRTVLLNADSSQAVWLVAFEGIVEAGDDSFVAHVGGTLDTTSGAVRMRGVVTEGRLLGAVVDWQGQMVDADASRFEGTIRLIQPSAGPGASEGGTAGSPLAGGVEGNGLPSHADVRSALRDVVAEDNGGFGLPMWAVIVDRDGVVQTVVFSGEDRGDQFPASRQIAAVKATTANGLSLPGLALSTANLHSGVQPGGSLYGLQASVPVSDGALGGEGRDFGSERDPLVGSRTGGLNVFGGGLALYDENGRIVGGVGVSGDSSCADHIVAWKLRAALELDYVPGGVSPTGDDNIVHDVVEGRSEGGWGHPECSPEATEFARALPESHPVRRAAVEASGGAGN